MEEINDTHHQKEFKDGRRPAYALRTSKNENRPAANRA